MIPKNKSQLEVITKKCRKLTSKAALLSAGGGAIPLPGVDVAVDVGILLKILPQINRHFGLDKEQVSMLDDQFKIIVYNVIKEIGTRFVGKAITKDIIISLIKKMGVKIASKQVTKYVPIVGTLISAGISFGAMKIICNYHINECREVVLKIHEKWED